MFWLIFGAAFGLSAGLLLGFGLCLARAAGRGDEMLGYKEPRE